MAQSIVLIWRLIGRVIWGLVASWMVMINLVVFCERIVCKTWYVPSLDMGVIFWCFLFFLARSWRKSSGPHGCPSMVGLRASVGATF